MIGCARFQVTLLPENVAYMLFCFRNPFLMNYMSITYKYFSGAKFLKLTKQVFVCDSENYSEICLDIIFLKILISAT